MSQPSKIRPYSRKIVMRMIIALLLTAVLLLLNSNFLINIYLRNQLTHVSLIINGGILLLFLVGMIKMAVGLARYATEEQALRRFVKHLDDETDDPLAGISSDSIIAHRFTTMQHLSEQHAQINHSAMAAALLARESTRGGTPRFINNILILGGVFGTIVSLSIALLGASNVLQNAINSSGMGMVINGMSTALSTTITAILCYLLHGYFFNAFGDAQTHLLGHIEEVTATRLMPMFQVDQKAIDYHVADLLKAIAAMLRRLDEGQTGVLGITQRLNELLDRVESEHGDVSTELADIRRMLRDGFRLPAQEESAQEEGV